MVFRIEIPPERHRAALKDDKEKVKSSEKHTACDEDADDPDLDLVNGDTKQEQADGQFEERCARGVEYLAEIPVLINVRS